MPMDTSFKRMLYRKLIYTGITRAKKLLIIVGSERVVNYMIQNVDSKKRNTGLSLTLVGEKEAFIYGTSKLMEERNTLLKEMLINSITF